MWHQWFNLNGMKLQEYFLCAKKTKITTLFNNCSLLCQSLRSHACVWCCWHRSRRSDVEPGCVHYKQRNAHACVVVVSWTCGEDKEEKKWLNKVVIFVFFICKEYSRSFIKLRLNHWCHMNYFNNVFTKFLGLECVSCVDVYGGSESSQISSKIS